MDLNQVKVDADKARNGAWIDVDDTTRLLIARAGGQNFRRTMQKYLLEHREDIANDSFSDDAYRNLLAEIMADCVLLGWEGLTENGEPIEYSKEKAAALLSDPDYEDFFEIVSSYAENIENFRERIDKESEANLKK